MVSNSRRNLNNKFRYLTVITISNFQSTSVEHVFHSQGFSVFSDFFLPYTPTRLRQLFEREKTLWFFYEGLFDLPSEFWGTEKTDLIHNLSTPGFYDFPLTIALPCGCLHMRAPISDRPSIVETNRGSHAVCVSLAVHIGARRQWR